MRSAPEDDALLRLHSLSFDEMDALQRAVRGGQARWPLCVLLGYGEAPLAVMPRAMSFLLECRRRRLEMKLDALSFRLGRGRESRLELGAAAEVTALAVPPALPQHRTLVIARSLADERRFDRALFESLAVACSLRGEWRLLHLLEWDVARRRAAAGLVPQTRRALPPGFRWRLLGPEPCEPRQGALWLNWTLLHAPRPGAAPVPCARVQTATDGMLLQVDQRRETRALGLFEVGCGDRPAVRPGMAVPLSQGALAA